MKLAKCALLICVVFLFGCDEGGMVTAKIIIPEKQTKICEQKHNKITIPAYIRTEPAQYYLEIRTDNCFIYKRVPEELYDENTVGAYYHYVPVYQRRKGCQRH